jgi:hypothetical protein
MMFFYNNMSLLLIFFDDMETARWCHILAGLVFVLSWGAGRMMDWLPDSVRGADIAGRPSSAPPSIEEPRRGVAVWRCRVDHGFVILLGLLAVTGGILVFRSHIGLELKYLVSAGHTVGAIGFCAITLAKIYCAFLRRTTR